MSRVLKRSSLFVSPMDNDSFLGINYESRAFLSTDNSSNDVEKITKVYERLGFGLSDSKLMTQAVTHKSFAHGSVPTNEKLSYLGKENETARKYGLKWSKGDEFPSGLLESG